MPPPRGTPRPRGDPHPNGQGIQAGWSGKRGDLLPCRYGLGRSPALPAPPGLGKHPPWDGVNQGFPASENRNKLRVSRGEK